MHQIVIHAEGIKCSHCRTNVEALCVPGTVEAVANLQEKIVTITGEASEAARKQTVAAAGYQVMG